ncbi:myosin heavy chain 95F-like [Tropilaelaps mercedesae]|uniref:Myosin heavy chain 95F-like n=1 Tax=Tropilaelaps mercedesae TaxID=418985 RepID=A0A1V9X956_9ACAR|nr:myosin heavy chain 95F-like [Tropilaelaps mercedesae]
MNAIVIAVGLCAVLFHGAAQPGYSHGWDDGDGYGWDLHGSYELDGYGGELAWHGGDDHHYVKMPIVTTHYFKGPVASYTTHSAKKVRFAKKPVYSISHKPVVISQGYSYHTSKDSGLIRGIKNNCVDNSTPIGLWAVQ